MSHYKPYPVYKDSEVEWLGRVPEHWQVKQLKYLAPHIGSGKTPSGGAEVYQDTGVLFLRSQNVYEEGLWLDDAVFISDEINEGMKGSQVKSHDVLLNITGASIGRSCLVPMGFERANVNQHVCIIRSTKSMVSKWVSNFLPSKIFQAQIDFSQNGAGREGLNFEQIGNMFVALPPTDEISKITISLDREKARIDALIERKTRFIELLREKRQALITHSITKGLSVNVKMKDSGVEWLGEVPEHWEIKRLQFLCTSMKAGPFGSALTKDMYVSSGYRVYGQEQVIPSDFSIGDYYITAEYFSELAQYSVQSGDVLVSCVGTFGKIAIVPKVAEPGIINPRLIRVRANQLISPDYLAMLMRSSVVFEQFSLWSRGGTMDVINIGTLSRIVLSVPPVAEQRAILNYIECEVGRIDVLLHKTECSINLLKERRSALITAAVTGQIDLREAI